MIKLKNSRRSITSMFAVLAVALIGVSLSHLSYAASGSLSLSPSSGSVTVGNNLVVTMYENSGTDAAIGVDAFVNYSSNLQFVSASTNTSPPFNVGTPDSASGGTVEIVRGDFTGQTGNQAVSTITFKTLSAGTGTVTFNNSKSVISPVSGSANLLVTSSGGSYTLSNPSSGGGGTTGGGGGTTSGGGGTTAPSTGATSTKATSVSVKPKNSAPAVTVPNNGAVAVNTPVSVQPATVQPDGVTKVEYYLGGKLVDTETSPPYKYNIDTTKLKNGTYNLVSKTYYTNGTVKQATQHLIVKNTATRANGVWLVLLIICIIVLIVVGINFIGPTAGDSIYKLFHHGSLPLAAGGPGMPGSKAIVTSGAPTASHDTDLHSAFLHTRASAAVHAPGQIIAPGSEEKAAPATPAKAAPEVAEQKPLANIATAPPKPTTPSSLSPGAVIRPTDKD